MKKSKNILIKRTSISLLLSFSIVFTMMLPMFGGMAASAVEVQANASQADAAYTAQYIKPGVTVTKTLSDLTFNIKGWQADYKYQIWSYQKVTSDIFLNKKGAVQANQWILSKEYALGSTGVVQPDGSINFSIDNFTSPNANCTVAVRIVDENGNFISELRDAYTPTEVKSAVITKVLVDGKYSTGMEIKEIKTGASVLIKVMGNLPDLTYTATILDTLEQIPVSSKNVFAWDISGLTPRDYTIRVTASNGTSTASKDISFKMYSGNTDIQYGVINSMGIKEGTSSALPKNITINANFSHGNFYYAVREPGRNAVISAGFMGEYPASQIIEQTITQYGIYYIYGYVSRPAIAPAEGTYDDSIVKKIDVRRSSVIPSSATLAANVSLKNPVAKGTNILFKASAAIGGIGTTPVQFSFWRYDASGYALVKDWSSDSTLSWTPARVGYYSIEVRAKGADAGSYETAKSVTVNVADSVDHKAQVSNIMLNQAELNASAAARMPIILEASATGSNGDKLLYEFKCYDKFLGTITLQNYSSDRECVWVPGKAGTDIIYVLIKNEVSFGKYDAIKSFIVTVR